MSFELQVGLRAGQRLGWITINGVRVSCGTARTTTTVSIPPRAGFGEAHRHTHPVFVDFLRSVVRVDGVAPERTFGPAHGGSSIMRRAVVGAAVESGVCHRTLVQAVDDDLIEVRAYKGRVWSGTDHITRLGIECVE